MRRDHGSLASSVLLISLAACSGGSGDPDASGTIDSGGNPDAAANPDAPGTPDAMVPDAYMPALGCLGAALPDTAPDPLTISGDVFDPGIPGFVDPMQLSGIELTTFAYGDETTALASDTSDVTTGNYALSATSGGVPLNAYIRARQPIDSNNSYISAYVYPGAPQAENQTGIRIPLIAESTFNLLVSFTGLSQENDQGLVTVLVVDCAGDPLAGATISSTPSAGTIAYLAGGMPSTTATMTDSTGLAFLLDVPIPTPDTTAEIEVSATYDSMPLRAHDVIVHEFLNTADDTPSMNDEHRMVTTQVVP